MKITVKTVSRPAGSGHRLADSNRHFKHDERMPHTQLRALFALYGTLEGALAQLASVECEGELMLRFDGTRFTGTGNFITYDKAQEHTARNLIAEMIETIHVIATGFSEGTATVEVFFTQFFKT